MGALNTAFAHHTDGSGVFESGPTRSSSARPPTTPPTAPTSSTSGWCNSPTTPTAKCDGFARIQEGSQPTDQFKFDTLAGPQLRCPFQPKGMHDEMNSANFDEWGG